VKRFPILKTLAISALAYGSGLAVHAPNAAFGFLMWASGLLVGLASIAPTSEGQSHEA
jgi:hypothetical protein